MNWALWSVVILLAMIRYEANGKIADNAVKMVPSGIILFFAWLKMHYPGLFADFDGSQAYMYFGLISISGATLAFFGSLESPWTS